MENFYFGIEDYCQIVFHGTEEDDERFEWFANNKRVLLKNGFGLESIIEENEEIFNIENEPKYFELIYREKSRYFRKLRLSSYMMN